MTTWGHLPIGRITYPATTSSGAGVDYMKIAAETIKAFGNGTAPTKRPPMASEYDGAHIEVPDSIEPIIAWREWNFRESGLLFSFNNQLWTPRRSLCAVCTHRKHDDAIVEEEYRLIDRLRQEVYGGGDLPKDLRSPPERDIARVAPVRGCTCGIYAKKYPIEGTQKIVGTVKLWGKIVLGTEGYRAQYAYPDKLYVLTSRGMSPDDASPHRRLAQRIGRLYQCDVSALEQDDYLDRVNLGLVELYHGSAKRHPGPSNLLDSVPDDADDDLGF